MILLSVFICLITFYLFKKLRGSQNSNGLHNHTQTAATSFQDDEMDLENEKDVLDAFPPEIWNKILGNITHPNDLTNCYNLTNCWRKLLHPIRTTFMIELMSKILLKIDNISKFSVKDLLKLRRLSQSWKAATDHFIQNHPQHFELEFSDDRRSLPLQMFTTDERFITKYNQFLEWTENFPNADPFFHRSIHYHEFSWGTQTWGSRGYDQGNVFPLLPRPFRPALSILDQRRLFKEIIAPCGDRIWNATFVLVLKDTNAESLYELIHSFLSHMQNLRTLWIKIEDEDDNDIQKMTPELNQLLRTLPLPPLLHLELLGLRNIPEPAESALLLKYNHVKRLSFQNNTVCHPSFPPDSIKHLNFSQLEHLRTFNYSVADIKMLEFKFAIWPLTYFKMFSVWPLTHLNLRWIQVVDLDLVFKATSSFSKTLKHLMMEFRGVKVHDFQNVTKKLQLPQLESLKITAVQSYLNNIDFMMPCISLRELELKVWIAPRNFDGNASAAHQQRIQFADYIDSMYTSNIWDTFNNLKEIKIQTVAKSQVYPWASVQRKYFYNRLDHMTLK